MKLAVILSCYNRIRYTEKCLEQLTTAISRFNKCYGKIYVFDDSSTDGTVEMIRNNFQNVTVLTGPGNYYWTKSMFVAMKKAIEDEHDFYLMVNDDVDFSQDVLDVMFEAYEEAGEVCGIVGATSQGDVCTYGGRTKEEILLPPNGKLQKCMWANWNCFLIPHIVVEKVGLLDNKYQHAYGDFDYSFRMYKKNIPIYVAPTYIGQCEKNSIIGTYLDKKLNKKRRMQLLFSPKGMPAYSYFRYNIRISGLLHLGRFICGYLSIIISTLCNVEKLDRNRSKK